ncbi:MAG: ABC transporter ATP-binding protein [Oscillospiraceae bacterium]|nr:ABC transporter ATP-binding protein [Oscillospiraceae bacterium]
MEFLTVEHLCKTYGKGETQVNALDDVSFTIPKGQMAAVIGPSGSGKSTLLHILGGVDRPTSGSVFLDGQDVYKQNNKNLAIFRRRQVGLIYQFYNLIPVLSAEENITLPMIMDGRKPDKKRLDDLLALLDLQQRRAHLPSQLSGGQQQRVSIGRALFSEPSVILADEPTGNLDSKNSAEIISLLRKSNREFKQTMIIITHDENIALQCDRVITLADGRITRDVLTGQ